MTPETQTHPANKRERSPVRALLACALFGCGFFAIGMSGAPEYASDPPPSAAKTPETDEDAESVAEEGLHECVITFKSGRSITGFLIESRDEEVVLRLEGIDTIYRRKNISSIRFLAPISERYRDIRDSIDDTDIETRLVFVEWLRTRQAYTLALEELSSILETAPNNTHARTLHAWLKAHLELASKKTSSDDPESTDNADNAEKPAADSDKVKHEKPAIPLLTEEQVNLMRVYELDLRDPPKMLVPDDTLRTLMMRHPDSFPMDTEDREELFDLPEPEKLRLLFTHRERDLYHKVRILEDPAMMKAFKSSIHSRTGWLINACASTRCHGGDEAGDFRLVNRRSNTDQAVYTNFLIIDQYRLDDGTPLIDYENPARSVLLQMATREINSLRPHPEVPLDRPGSRFRPIFRSSRDRKYQQAIEWIGSIYQPRVKYDLGYPPAAATDEPTTANAPDEDIPDAPSESP